MRVEDRVSEELGIADCGLRNAQRRLAKIVVGKVTDRRAAKDGHQQFDIARRCRFVQGNADCVRAKRAQVAPGFCRMFQNDFSRFDFDPNCVEEIFVPDCATKRAQTICKLAR